MRLFIINIYYTVTKVGKMSKMTRYELQTELKAILEQTGLKMNIMKLNKLELEEEIRIQKLILINKKWNLEKSNPGRLGPRAVRFETNEEGLNVPVGVVERLSKPPVRRETRGRPPKVKPAPPPVPVSVPEAIQTNSISPALIISDRVLTLGADDCEEIGESKISLPVLRCTCFNCPAHTATRKI